MLTIACVLKSGGQYNETHVHKLHTMVNKYLKTQHRFVCLTDIPEKMKCNTIKLENNWPGWWAKLELFKPNLFDDVVIFLDLDTIIMGYFDKLISKSGTIKMVKSYQPLKPRELNSSILIWNGDHSHIYEAFKKDPLLAIHRYGAGKYNGDQAFITAHTKTEPLSGVKVVSYKLDLDAGKNPLPEDTSIIIFHGKTKPWSTELQHNLKKLYG